MNQYFLVARKVHQLPPGDVPRAESYLINLLQDNENTEWLLEVLSRIFNILSSLALDMNGEISGLSEQIQYDGQMCQCLSDCYFYNPPFSKKHHIMINYTILKKLNSYNHSYEIRFKGGSMNHPLSCRVFLAPNDKVPCFILTYGFSKLLSIDHYYGIGSANRVTDVLSKISNIIFYETCIKNGNANATSKYLGKRGERHEIKF